MSERDDGGIVVSLVGGGEALVSPCDATLVQRHKWRIGSNGYVYRVGGRVAGVPCLLHRVVMDAKQGHDVHHKSGDKTDCRRANLEQLSPSAHQRHHSHLVTARNVASRKYALTGTCPICGTTFTKDPDHRGRQKCCSKRCACRTALAARMGDRYAA